MVAKASGLPDFFRREKRRDDHGLFALDNLETPRSSGWDDLSYKAERSGVVVRQT
jgi:hypothetical protein